MRERGRVKGEGEGAGGVRRAVGKSEGQDERWWGKGSSC